MRPCTRSFKTLVGAMTTIAPIAAPPIVRSSAGWMSAPTWPPDSVKPPSTQAMTTMIPTITTMMRPDLYVAIRAQGSGKCRTRQTARLELTIVPPAAAERSVRDVAALAAATGLRARESAGAGKELLLRNFARENRRNFNQDNKLQSRLRAIYAAKRGIFRYRLAKVSLQAPAERRRRSRCPLLSRTTDSRAGYLPRFRIWYLDP